MLGGAGLVAIAVEESNSAPAANMDRGGDDFVGSQLVQQQAANDELKRILENDTDDEIIERVARDQFGYARPSERVFYDMSGK